jgi:ABC-type Zn2+ transport system substrate-binding protein/surface adhesin
MTPDPALSVPFDFNLLESESIPGVTVLGIADVVDTEDDEDDDDDDDDDDDEEDDDEDDREPEDVSGAQYVLMLGIVDD